jgi:predicted transglutaminase-like cysteine proteinase
MRRLKFLAVLMCLTLALTGCAWFNTNQNVINVLADTAASIGGCEFAKKYPDKIGVTSTDLTMLKLGINAVVNPADGVALFQSQLDIYLKTLNDPEIMIGVDNILKLLSVPTTGPLSSNANAVQVLADISMAIDSFDSGMDACTPAKLAAKKAKISKLKVIKKN